MIMPSCNCVLLVVSPARSQPRSPLVATACRFWWWAPQGHYGLITGSTVGGAGEVLKGNWQPLAVPPLDPALADYSKLSYSPFVIGTYYLAKRVTGITDEKRVIEEAAGF